MKRTLSLAVGFAAGYVVGAHAGREKYEQIQRKVRQFGEIPAVAQTRAAVRGRIDSASHAVAEKIAETPSETSTAETSTPETSTEGISSVPAQTKRNGSDGEEPVGRRTVFPATGILEGGGAGEVLP